MIDAAYAELVAVTSTKRACGLLGKSRATHYRRKRPMIPTPRSPRPAPANKLSAAERAGVLATLNHESFVDKSVAQALTVPIPPDLSPACRAENTVRGTVPAPVSVRLPAVFQRLAVRRRGDESVGTQPVQVLID